MSDETGDDEMADINTSDWDHRRKAFAFWRRKGSERQESFEEQASKWLTTNRKRLGAVFAKDNPLQALEQMFFGGRRRWFVSNASHFADKDCREKTRGPCPFSGHEDDCVKTLATCSSLIIRPDLSDPAFSALADGSKIPALRCYISGCPHRSGGASLAVDRLVEASKDPCLPWEKEIEAELFEGFVFRLPAGLHNALTPEFIGDLSPVSIVTTKNLSHWRDYLDWRARLSRVRSYGLRIISHKVDEKSGVITLYVIGQGQEMVSRAVRSFRDGAMVYGSEASTDKWTFTAADPEKTPIVVQSDDGSQRTRKRSFFEGAKMEEMMDARPEIRPAEGRVPEGCPLTDAYYAELRFEGAEHSSRIVDGGFIVNDCVADEILIRRLKRVVEDFGKFGSIASPRLPAYLFDITRARVPESVPGLSEEEWINRQLNAPQRRAVEKMLAVEDIALLQGPPGTGKTEVGAEATAHLVRRGERVLIASQSMAAVDNMIERLPRDPAIRVLRVRSSAAGRHVSMKEAESQALDEMRPWYEALGLASAQVMKERGALKSRRNEAQNCLDQLSPLADRLTEEMKKMDQRTEARAKAEAEYRAATVAQHEAERADRQIAAAEKYARAIAKGEVGEDFEDIPEAAVLAVEKSVSSVFADMRGNGVSVFEYLPGGATALRAHALALAFDKFTRIEKNFAMVSQDLERLQNTASHVATTAEDTVRLADIDREIAGLEERINVAFDTGDYDLAGRLGCEHRKYNQERKRLASGGGLDESVYRRIFNVKTADGTDPVEVICRPGQKPEDVMAELRKWCGKFSDWSGAIRATRDEMPAIVASSIDRSNRMADAKARLDNAGAALRLASSKVKEAEVRSKGLREAFAQEVRKATEKLGLHFAAGATPSSIEAAVVAIREEVDRRLSETDPGIAGDLMREWVKLTSKPTGGDFRRVYDDFIRNATVVGATCSTNFRHVDELTGGEPFDTAIIDEVSKATPPELLAAMCRAHKTVLMGDHRQLPPLFGEREPLSMEEIECRECADESVPEKVKITLGNFADYRDMVEASIFKDFFEKADDRIKETLTVQFRMHPQIMAAVNRFYGNQLACGLDSAKVETLRDHQADRLGFADRKDHLVWIDSSVSPDGQCAFEEPVGTSYENPLEAEMIVSALKQIDAERERKGLPVASAAVIAFYGRQKGLLKRCIQTVEFKRLNVRVDTVDRFQGGQAPYVLVSMTRAPKRNFRAGEKAFVAKFERINVAFSRAQSLLLIFGSRRFFAKQLVTVDPAEGRTPVYRHILESLDLAGRLRGSADVLGHALNKGRGPENNARTNRKSRMRAA